MAPPEQRTVVTAARTSSKNLLQQLPAGAVLAFQALAATFTNQGNCYRTNKWLTAGLVTVLSATCIFFSFTDSLVYKGKVYYGVATPGRLNILNMPEKEELVVFKDLKPELKRRGLKVVDWVHAFLSLVVFLTVAGNDVGLQNCFFPKADDDTRQWLRNLPLGMSVMTSFLFMIFPTTRKGIRFDNSSGTAPAPAPAPARGRNGDGRRDGQKPAAVERAIPAPAPTPAPAPEKNGDGPTDGQKPAATAARAIPAPAPDPAPVPAREKNGDDGPRDGQKPAATERAITSTATLLQRLPTGPVLAFQTLAASFTNQGKCYPSNFWLTMGLVIFLGATCVFSSFTDCIRDPKTGQVHKGVAVPGRLHIIGMSKKDQKAIFGRSTLEKGRLKTMDWVHAFFTAVVFLTIAGSDVGLQNCFFPEARDDRGRQLLKNLPLGIAVLSSFVFVIFPTTRKGMGFDDTDYIVIIPPGDEEDQKGRPNPASEPTTTASTIQPIHQTNNNNVLH